MKKTIFQTLTMRKNGKKKLNKAIKKTGKKKLIRAMQMNGKMKLNSQRMFKTKKCTIQTATIAASLGNDI